MPYSLRQKLGVIGYDLPRFIWAMRPSGLIGTGLRPWVGFHNRNERLIRSECKTGVACDWQWTSDLHIAKVFPWFGLQLMKRSLRDWPIALGEGPVPRKNHIDVSFIIGHRGMARLPHLLMALKSISAQREVSAECIVVEQSSKPEIKSLLPDWVNYAHTPLAYDDMPYCRSWAFNVGARLARGELLVLHDNDLLIPRDYAAQLMMKRREGYEVINLKRFVFYLTEADSLNCFSASRLALNEAPERVLQNTEGGGTVAVSREAYFAIGGFDESFVGWGGEDNEFWERAVTRRLWPYGYLPIAHLWHSPQAGKFDPARSTAALQREQSRVPVEQRISNLTSSAR